VNSPPTTSSSSLPQSSPTELSLKGTRISAVLASGTVWVAGDILDSSAETHRIEPYQVETEMERIRRAFIQVEAELEEAARRISEQIDPSLAEIFRAHQLMLESLLSSNEFERELRGSLIGAAEAVKRVFRNWEAKFAAIEDDALHQRADDILDLARRVLRQLEGPNGFGLATMPIGSVLVTQRLLPSDVVAVSPRNVKAIVVESLGQGSHAALLAREKGIPTLTGLPGLLSQIHSGDEALVDAFREALIVSPNPETRRDFEQRLEKYRASLLTCRGQCGKPAITRDGQTISVEANLATHAGVDAVIENGADGVGLLRTEELYFGRELPPSEEELFSELQRLVAPLHDKPVTIRLLDIGGDKAIPFLRLPFEANPLLGKRGVRVLLDYPQLARTQLKTLLRLSQAKTFVSSCRWLAWRVTYNRCASCSRRSLPKWVSKTFPLSAQ
jgi:phosphoenolpyruvate-protein kinase (PTS system EI component)